MALVPGGVDYSADPVLPAWYVPGWTAQNFDAPAGNQFSLPAPPIQFTFSNLPAGLLYINVTGNYNDGMGNAMGGYLTFEQSQDLLLLSGGVNYRIPSRMVGIVPNQSQNFMAWNAEGSGRVYLIYGQLTVMLLATDTPGITIQSPADELAETDFTAPLSWVYHVKEYFYRGYQYDITVPMASASVPVDINTLIVAGTYLRNDDWNRGI